MDDALKILGTLIVAGFLTLALTNTSITDVASSARNNLALETTNTDSFPLNNNDIFVSQESVSQKEDERIFANNTNSIDNRLVVNNNNALNINNGIYADDSIDLLKSAGNKDNQRVINGETQNIVRSQFANSASNDDYREIVIPSQRNTLGTASVVDARNGVMQGSNGFTLWLLLFVLIAVAGFLFYITNRKKNRVFGNNFGYAPAYQNHYYDIPQNGYASYPMNAQNEAVPYPEYQNPTSQPLQKQEPAPQSEVPEYRINLG